MYSKPQDDSFYHFEGGNYLDFFSNQETNLKAYGSGYLFDNKKKQQYLKIVQQQSPNIQWVLRNLETKKIISQSTNAAKQFYGASVSKIFVAGSYLNFTQGYPSEDAIEHLNNLIIVSSNTSWSALQILIGEGSENIGRKRVDDFLKLLGITRSIGFRGYLGTTHGNEVNAVDISKFIQDSYDEKYPGSLHLFQTMFLSRTGKLRGRKYLPKKMNIGGKTGTYNGKTTVDGKLINSKSKHHTMVFKKKNNYYSLTVLSDPGTDEEIALICAGLISQI